MEKVLSGELQFIYRKFSQNNENGGSARYKIVSNDNKEGLVLFIRVRNSMGVYRSKKMRKSYPKCIP